MKGAISSAPVSRYRSKPKKGNNVFYCSFLECTLKDALTGKKGGVSLWTINVSRTESSRYTHSSERRRASACCSYESSTSDPAAGWFLWFGQRWAICDRPRRKTTSTKDSGLRTLFARESPALVPQTRTLQHLRLYAWHRTRFPHWSMWNSG